MFKALRSYPTPEEASIAAGMLAAHGIDAQVSTNAASTLFPAPDGGLAESVLYVPDSDATRAEALLEEHGD